MPAILALDRRLTGWAHPPPSPLNCCKYAAGPPGWVPDALEEVPRVSGWLRSSPRTAAEGAELLPPSVAAAAGAHGCQDRAQGAEVVPVVVCAADILKGARAGGGAHGCQDRRPGCRGGAGGGVRC